jgi:hypothetical protein
MSTNLETALTATLGKAAREAGLTVLSAEAGTDFNNHPTAKFKLALSPDAPPAKALQLELSDAFDFQKPDLLPEMTRQSVCAIRAQMPMSRWRDCLSASTSSRGRFTALPPARTPTSFTALPTSKTARLRRCTRRYLQA